MNHVALLRRAIQERRQVIATYQGRPREFCPHVLGTTKGEWVCLAYQFGGESSRPLVPGSDANWRCFKAHDLSNVTVRDGEWHTCPPRKGKPQRCVEVVELEV
jgi:hypothetical protein